MLASIEERGVDIRWYGYSHLSVCSLLISVFIDFLLHDVIFPSHITVKTKHKYKKAKRYNSGTLNFVSNGKLFFILRHSWGGK